MFFVVLTAVAATLALFIGWTGPGEDSSVANRAENETIHGKATP